jgi:2'-5' RNA ligase
MPYAITLRLDAKAASRVLAMWDELAARGVSDDAIRLGYPPHLTLAILPDGTDEGRLLATTQQIAARWHALPVSLASIGFFPGEPTTMFLAPVVTPELLGRHAELLASLAGETIDPHYQIGHWVPHVTLAKDLPDVAAAVATPHPPRLPIDATLNMVELVRFRPVEILFSSRLIAP